jgi:hypothetical protein
MSASTARIFSENMSGAYNLLPSTNYFNYAIDPVVVFDPTIDSISNLRKTYGSTITDQSTLTSFLLAQGDKRPKPSESDLTLPTILNQTLLTVSTDMHTRFDQWSFPSHIKTINIIGSGINTVQGTKYYNKDNTLDYKPIFTQRGDGTVVTLATLSHASTTYYFDISRYNSSMKSNISHANILESHSVQNLIENLIVGNEYQDTYVSQLEFFANPQLQINIHSPVTLDLYDFEGNHTGSSLISINTDSKLVEEKIPNSYYLPFGEGVYTGVSSNIPVTAHLQGTGMGVFTLDVGSTTYSEIPVLPTTIAEIKVSQATSSDLLVDMDGDGIYDMTIQKDNSFDPTSYLLSMKKLITTLDIPDKTKSQLLQKLTKVIGKINTDDRQKMDDLIRKYSKSLTSRNKYSKKISSEDITSLVTMLQQLLDILNQ